MKKPNKNSKYLFYCTKLYKQKCKAYITFLEKSQLIHIALQFIERK